MIKAVIVDYARTIADSVTDQLFPEAQPFLMGLKERDLKAALVSRTADPEGRRETFKKLGLHVFFDFFDVFPSEGSKDFTRVFEELDVKPENTLVIGDRIKSEIFEGNKAGAITLWVKQGKFADELPETDEEQPDFTITSLSQALDIIDSLIK